MEQSLKGHERPLFEPITSDIIDRARRGDLNALSGIYRRYRLDIYRYLYYRVGQLEVAEDLTSEVFERMIRSIGKSRFQNTTFEAWLFQIARNLAIDYYRKMGIRDHVPLDEKQIAVEQNVDQTVEHNMVSDQLVHALNGLNEAQRDVVILRFAVSMPITQVAQTLNKSEDAIKGLQRRGLMAMRKILSDWEENNA